MKPYQDKVLLNNGTYIPLVGLGTGHITSPFLIKETLNNALDLGYRHFDFSPSYQNENFFGKFLNERLNSDTHPVKVSRSDLYYTSKIWNLDHHYVRGSVQASLKSLKTDYLDLLLVHWPVTFCKNVSTNCTLRTKEGLPEIEEFDVLGIWESMQRQIDKECVMSIGVSNFGIKNLTKLIENCTLRPAVNQIECHPYFQNREVVKLCKCEGIMVVAHSPLCSDQKSNKPDIFRDPVIKNIAIKYGISMSQVILSYTAVNKNIPVIPKATNENFLAENINLVLLSDKDEKLIDSLEKNVRYIDPYFFGDKKFD